MRKICLLLALGFSLAATAQKAANPQPFASTITPEDLQKHLYIVAGKEMEGRETATEGQRKAARYIEDHFKSLGLIPGNNGSYQMPFPVYQDEQLKAYVEVNGKTFEPYKDFFINLASSYSATMMGSEVVFVGDGTTDSTHDSYKGIDAKGKIVLVMNPKMPSGGRARVLSPGGGVLENAQKNGAAAILWVQPGFPRRSSGGRGFQYLNPFRKSISPNIFAISEDIAQAIMGNDLAAAKESMNSKGWADAKTYQTNVVLSFNKAIEKIESSNVIGYLEGTDKKDEYVFLTAHYDHLGKVGDSVIYYGADDDGSGTVSILELAEAFAKAKAAGKGPRRSIVFMTVSGEEKGLWGSAYYGDHPLFPLEKTTVDLNIDMIGRMDPKRTKGDSTNYVYVVGDDKLSSDLRPISEAMNKKYTKLELDYKYNDPNDKERIYYRSDHFNFARKGVPIIFYFNGTHNDYHRPTDTPDKINYQLMAKRAQLVFYTAWDMANRNEMLKRDIPLEIPGR